MTVQYALSDLVVDLDARTVRRGDDVIRLPDLSFDVFARLIRNAPAPVGAEALARDAWGRAHVSDETLAQRIALLRKALGDDPKAPRYVRTVRGAGYALAAPVETLAAPETRRRRRGGLVAGGAAALAALVVLIAAFAMMRGPQDADAGSSSRSYAPSTVDTLVERAGAQLALHQAAETDRAIQMLREARSLDPDSRGAALGLSFALSTRATKFRADKEDVKEAETLARDALSTDDADSRAWKAFGYALDAQGRVDEALAAYQRAYNLDPEDVGAISSAAYLLSVRGRLFEALVLEARGLEYAPSSRYAEIQAAQVLDLLDHPAAPRWLTRARLLNPGQVVVVAEAAEARLRRSDPDGALAILSEASERGRASPRLLRLAGRAELMRGQIDVARAAFVAAGYRAAFDIAALDAQNGDVAAGEDLLRAAEADMIAGDSWPELRVRMAELHAVLGRDDEALRLLSQAVDLGWRDTAALSVSPFLGGLVEHPQWDDLLLRIARELDAQRALVEAAPERIIIFE